MSYLKKAYTKVFPLTSVRRFIVDQIIDWSLHLGYYGGIVIGLVSGFVLGFYIIGAILVYYYPTILQNKNGVMPGQYAAYFITFAFGIMLSFVGLIIGIAIAGLCSFTYHDDYLPWCESQKKYIVELEQGTVDDEAIRIPVVPTKFESLSYTVLPLGSLQRYILRILLFLTISIIIIIFHMHFSLWTLSFDNSLPWGAKWLISSSIQCVVGLIISLFYCCIEESCQRDWKKFKQQRESAVSKK